MKNSDDGFLEQIIAAVKILTQASKEQMLGIKNFDSEIIYYSNAYADFLGFKPEEIIGKKTFSSLYDNPNIEATIVNEDKIVIETQKQMRFLKINRVNGVLKPYVCIKSPLINPNTNNLVGIMLHGLEISVLNLNQQIINSYQHLTNLANKNIKLPNLSHRERQVVFLFMNQLTSQEIADVIYKIEGSRVSKSTIDSLFNDQLYIKFNVHSRVALLEKLQQLGYGNLIPSDVLSSTSTPLDTINIF